MSSENTNNLSFYFNITERYQKYPYIIPIISFALFVTHVCNMLYYKINWNEDFTKEHLISIGALSYNDIVYETKIWQFFTYSTVHNNLQHITNNIIVLLIIGSYFEIKYGWYIVSAIYLFSIIGSSVLFCTLHKLQNNTDDFILIGSSGGVFGLFGSLISELYFKYNTLTNKLGQKILISVIILLNIFEYIIFDDVNKAHILHLCGIIYGIIPAGLYIQYEHKQYIFFVASILFHILFFLVAPIILFN